MARLHSKRGAMHEINVVPYVDVMLVLLVIFMVTAPLVTPGVIDLPIGRQGRPAEARAAGGGDQGGPQPLAARARRDGPHRERPAGRRAPSSPKIIQGPEVPVLVAGDKNVRYEAVLQVMDDLRAQGVERVGLQVKPRQ